MLAIRSHCEGCKKTLPPDSREAMICSFECTFCARCVRDMLKNVCPNCGGGFEKRPIRPKEKLSKYPTENSFHIAPYDTIQHKEYLQKYSNLEADKR